MNDVARDPETGMSQQDIIDKQTAISREYLRRSKELSESRKESHALHAVCERIGHVFREAAPAWGNGEVIQQCVVCCWSAPREKGAIPVAE